MSKEKICSNKSCHNTSPKDKWGNYKLYCSNECMKISRQAKFQDTYKTKDKKAILEKRKTTLKEKYGVDNASHIPEVIEQLRITTKETTEIRLEKTRLNNLARFGVESTNSLPEVKEKKKKTLLEKYGVDHQLRIPEVAASVATKNKENAKERLEKAKETNTMKYGCLNPSSNNDIKTKRTNTMVKRFGVENASQSAEVHAKKMKSKYKTKEFIFPSGRCIRVQGYEPQALTELLKIYNENEIITDTMLKPKIKYIKEDGSIHFYFPDIYIPKDNLLIEVKSQYTYNGFKGWYETNIRKQQGSIDAGYNFKFMIMSKK